MYVYLNGAKERANPSHRMYVAPAAMAGANMALNDIPAEWIERDAAGNLVPKSFTLIFQHGRADVPNNIGELLITTGHAHRSNIIVRTTGAMLGALADMITSRR